MKKIRIFIVILLIVALAIVCYLVFDKIQSEKNANNHVEQKENEILNVIDDKNEEDDDEKLALTKDITVVPTMQDNITADSAWCATFQLVWNEMKDEVVRQDVVFEPQLDMAENLNKEEFTKDMISDEYYYLNWGLKSLKLKKEIEKGIKEKFNQKSDILELFDWSEEELNDESDPDNNRYFFYTMLYRKFEFPKVFDVLDNDDFGDDYSDVEYFGIDDSSNSKLYEQVRVLYYNSKSDFAIKLLTKSGDEVIVAKGANGRNFAEIYENINVASEQYDGDMFFNDNDRFKMPKLDFNVLREYKELANKKFYDAEGNACEIAKAMQSIKFSINEVGGKIKSEAAIDTNAATDAEDENQEPRYCYVDDEFTIFLKEEDRDVPYFAARVTDISKYQ